MLTLITTLISINMEAYLRTSHLGLSGTSHCAFYDYHTAIDLKLASHRLDSLRDWLLLGPVGEH